MRRFWILLFFVLIVGFAQTTEARKLALLVGVDEYDDVPSLKCCVNDMKTLKDALTKIGFLEDDIQVLVTGGTARDFPTKKKIERRISEILSSAGPKDLVFLAFSGHGAQEGKNVFFCPPEAETDDLEGTCVSITKVMDDLARCQAKFKWMVVDACRNDPNSRDVRGLQVVPSPPAGIALFQSCAKGEKSFEEKRSGGNGYFTKNFAAALSGEADANHDGQLTLMEVCTWTTAQTKMEVEKAENQTQRPYFSGSVSDFILNKNLNVPKARALAEEAQKAMDAKNYALAIEKFDAALALWEFDYWKRERDLAKQLLEQEKRIKEAEEKERQTARAEPMPAPAEATLPTSSLQAGERIFLRADGIEYAFCWCPPGRFVMGGDRYEWSNSDFVEKSDRYQVELTQGFWMLETEVTQEMWRSVMGRNPSYFNGARNPVEQVCWDDCQRFCQRLSQMLGQQIRLPTEAQWEYACRAGTTERYAGNLDSMAWYNESYAYGSTHPVAKKQANAWGLYDMHGNVWEWCADYYEKNYYTRSPKSDPENRTPSSRRVIRGGGWGSSAGYCRSGTRSGSSDDNKYNNMGLRVVLVPGQD